MTTRDEIIEKMRLKGCASPAYLQKCLRISYKEAKKICDDLTYEEKQNIEVTHWMELPKSPLH